MKVTPERLGNCGTRSVVVTLHWLRGKILMKLHLRIAATLFLINMAFSGAPAIAAGWTEPLTITAAFVEDSDLLVVYTSGGSQVTPGCTPNAWIVTAANDDRRARLWATILTALATGRKVILWRPDSCAAWNFHQATAVMVGTF